MRICGNKAQPLFCYNRTISPQALAACGSFLVFSNWGRNLLPPLAKKTVENQAFREKSSCIHICFIL